MEQKNEERSRALELEWSSIIYDDKKKSTSLHRACVLDGGHDALALLAEPAPAPIVTHAQHQLHAYALRVL
jgi:hypothetical protein